MDPSTDVFSLAERRLNWLARRQDVLAQNVANANTPGYQPKDIKPFSAVLDHQESLGVNRSSPLHLGGVAASGTALTTNSRERSPDGNAVSLETELGHVADTTGQQELVSNLYRKYHGMFRIALGRS